MKRQFLGMVVGLALAISPQPLLSQRAKSTALPLKTAKNAPGAEQARASHELRKSSPAALLGAYKKGYNLSMKKSKLRGRRVWEITMTAISSVSRPERVVIDIAQDDYVPMCLRARNDGNWTRFAIFEYAVKQQFSENEFRFRQEDYPTAEVIDLR